MTTCDDVRPLLPDHVLGSLEDPDDTGVRRHLRGCAGCRRELETLREGLDVFGSTLERPAPPELRARVLGVLSEEWEEADVAAPTRSVGRRAWVPALAASIALAVLAGAFGLAQLGRARDAEADAARFRTILATLGGTGFRAGSLRAAGDSPVEGSVLAYQSSHEQSFLLLFIRVRDLEGKGAAVVTRRDGTTWEPGQVEFDGDGDAAAWWVTPRGIGTITDLTLTGPDGSTLATARIRAV